MISPCYVKYDQSIYVKYDQSIYVKYDQSIYVKYDQSIYVKYDQSIYVKYDQTPELRFIGYCFDLNLVSTAQYASMKVTLSSLADVSKLIQMSV